MDVSIFVFILWNVLGFVILLVIGDHSKIIGNCPNFDFLIPAWLYNKYQINWFGAFMLCLFLNILCPVLSVGYYFYKLCKIGRREKNMD